MTSSRYQYPEHGRLSIQVEKETWEKIKEIADKEKRPMSHIVRRIINRELKQRDDPKPQSSQ